jgi:hypothetical protein
MTFRMPWKIGKQKKDFNPRGHDGRSRCLFSVIVRGSVILTFATVGRTKSSATANVTLKTPAV